MLTQKTLKIHRMSAVNTVSDGQSFITSRKTQINISAFVAVIKPDWQLFHTRIGVSVFKLRKKK